MATNETQAVDTAVLTVEQIEEEQVRCLLSPHYFVDSFCHINDPNSGSMEWNRFRLWPAQFDALDTIIAADKMIILKARQLGITWLLLAYALWLMLFRPGSIILMFSRTGGDATELISRLQGMHDRLPEWLQASVDKSNEQELSFTVLGSKARSYNTTKHSGRSMTASLVIIDEADFIEWLRQLLNAAEETADAGGQLAMVSTSDKEKPNSKFKQVWKTAVSGNNNYTPLFLPWSARPERDQAWYEQKKRDKDEDDLFQEYPATPAEALRGHTANKRFNREHLLNCFDEAFAPLVNEGPALPSFTVYEKPTVNGRYLVAVDTCEGNPNSDPSPITVFDRDTWAEVAHMYGRFEPATLAGYAVQIATYFNGAIICPERNNHGHAMILATKELIANHNRVDTPSLYVSPNDGKNGWLTSPKWKVLSFDNAAECFKSGDCRIRTEGAYNELLNMEASTLKAPEGDNDDIALSYIIGLAALKWPSEHTAVGGFSASY